MSKKKHHNKKNNRPHNNPQKDVKDIEIESTESDDVLDDDIEEEVIIQEEEEENTDFLEDEDRVDIQELQNIIDDIEDIKPYEERRARNNKLLEKEKRTSGLDKRVILVIASLVLAVALFTTLIVDACCSSSSDKKFDVTTAKLKEVTNEKVITLMNDYIVAVQNGDMDSLSKVVDNIDNISVDKLARESEYIEKYENIKLNYIKGINEGDFVIFMSYDNKIMNIDTLAPGAMMVYVIKDNDKYLVHTGVQNDKEVLKYLEELAKNENVVEFNENVNKAFEEACKSDKNLAEFKAAITSTEEKSEKDEETTEAVEETTTKKKKK